MKTRLPIIAVGIAAACSAALATEYGTVISSTPVSAQVAVPQQQCNDEPQLVQTPNTGAGALFGAIVGGAIGNSVGAGMGRAAATGLGVVAGAAIGDRAEASNSPPVQTTVRRCATVTGYQNRVVGYDVVYEYRGQRYSTRMAQDPGQRIALDVNVAPAGGAAATAPAPVYSPPPAYSQAPVYSPPVYSPPVVYAAPAPVYGYYAPYGYYGGYYGYAGPALVVAPSLVFGVGGHWRHGR
jgi:uncharacterized protein YcfJ